MLKGQVDFSKSIMLHLILDLKVKTQKWSTLVLQGVTVYSVPARWLWLPTHSLSFISHPFFSWVITFLRLFVRLSAASIITIQLIFWFFFLHHKLLIVAFSCHSPDFIWFSYVYILCCILISVDSITCIFVACLVIPLLGLLYRGRRGRKERAAPQAAPQSPPQLSPPLNHLRLSPQHPSHQSWRILS